MNSNCNTESLAGRNPRRNPVQLPVATWRILSFRRG